MSDDYTIFHSLHWNERNDKGRIEWGETDFTIIHPVYGILVVEVKSGGISLINGQWWYERTDDHQRFTMKDPMKQADRNKYNLMEKIEYILPPGEYCWFEPIVWFPSLDDKGHIGELPNTYHNENVLMKGALKNPRQAIENAYRFYDTQKRTNLSQESVDLIIRTFAPAFNAVPSLSSIYSEQEYLFLRLTKEQSGLLDYLEEQPTAVIQGGAGTGKTMLAVEKARRLAQRGRVLFLCFNRFLMDDLRKKNKDYGIDFYNLQTLFKSRAQIITGNTITDEDIIYYLNNFDKIGDWDYRHIIIDEGQDFADEHLNLLAIIAKYLNGSFYVFYDRNQMIQRREMPEWLQQAECRLILRKNCRNTHSIASTACRPLNLEPIVWENSPKGNLPDFHILEDIDSFEKKILELINKYHEASIPEEQIVILTLKTENTSLLSNKEKIGKWKLAKSQNESGILFTTARKFKGLESAVVLIVDLDASCPEKADFRNLFYVGASRAKDFLDIIALANNEGIQNFARALIGKDVKNGTSKIASTFKVRIKRQ